MSTETYSTVIFAFQQHVDETKIVDDLNDPGLKAFLACPLIFFCSPPEFVDIEECLQKTIGQIAR